MSGDSRRLRIRAGGVTYRVEVPPDGPLSVEGASAPVAVERLDETTFRAVVDGRRILVRIVAAGAGCEVFADGCAFALEPRPDAAEAARAEPPAGGPELTSPMPATVAETRVEPGRRVQAGDVLVVLEAMKMELTIRAPRDGIVDALHCRKGDLVQPAAPLVTLRPDGEA